MSALLLLRFGLAMVVVGLTQLWVSAVQHRRDLNLLGARVGRGPTSLAVVALLVGAIGIMALLKAWLRQ